MVSCLASVVPSGNHVKDCTLPILQKLRDALRAEELCYCQWKGHWKRFRWGQGEGDVDVLVDRADLPRLVGILSCLGFKQALPPRWSQIAGLSSYFGYDAEANKIVHIHVHCQLILGNPPKTTYRLPIEKPFLESVTPGPLFPIPAPEFEFIIFVIRAVLGYSARDLVRPAQSGADTVAQNELAYLRARTDRAALHTLLERHLPFLDCGFFDRCARSLEAPTSAMRRLGLRWLLRRKLQGHAHGPNTFQAMGTLGLRVFRKIRSLIAGPRSQMRLTGGGALVALVGGDGAGKSTLVNDLRGWLSKNFDAQTYHLGKPPRSLLTIAVSLLRRVVTRLSKLAKGDGHPNLTTNKVPEVFPSYLQQLLWVCIASDRYRQYVKARRFAAGGGLAICDRYPIPEIQSMDGPNIGRTLLRTSSRFTRLLQQVEAWFYRHILPPDLLIVLRVDPEIAVRRKADEDGFYVRARSREIWETNWQDTRACVVDAGLPLEVVRAELRSLIWSEL